MSIEVSVVLAMPNKQKVVELTVDEGCTAREALMLSLNSGIDLASNGLDASVVPLGVFGERVADDWQLENGDRVEIYRELAQDPKELRRRRAEQSREKKNKP